jgi:predicted aspartyl protease
VAVSDAIVVSDCFPYVPVRLQVRDSSAEVEALLDTGFDGHVVVPAHLVTNGTPADTHSTWTLADGSEVVSRTYQGTAQIGDFPPLRVLISVIGDEPIIGRALTRRFSIHLDHGSRVIIEP